MTFWTILGIAAVILVWCLAWSIALLVRRQLGESVGGSEWERANELNDETLEMPIHRHHTGERDGDPVLEWRPTKDSDV